MYHEDNAYSSSVFSILILGFIPISVNYIFGTLLTANGSFKALNYTAGSLAVINILLNLVLIPSHKALGAAVSSLITQSIAAVVQVYICIKILNIKFEMTEVLKYLLFAVLSILTVTLMSKLNGEWVLRFLTTAVLVCAMAIISGVLSVKAILQFVKQQSWGFKV